MKERVVLGFTKEGIIFSNDIWGWSAVIVFTLGTIIGGALLVKYIIW